MKNSQTLRILSLWSSIVLICIINTGTIKANQDYDPGDTIDVVHYNIHINYVDYGTHEIQGFAEVILTPKFDDINVITMELMDLTVD